MVDGINTCIYNDISKENWPWRNICLHSRYECADDAKVVKMKYIFACLIVPIVPVLLIAVFGIGALYFGVTNQMEQKVR